MSLEKIPLIRRPSPGSVSDLEKLQAAIAEEAGPDTFEPQLPDDLHLTILHSRTGKVGKADEAELTRRGITEWWDKHSKSLPKALELAAERLEVVGKVSLNVGKIALVLVETPDLTKHRPPNAPPLDTPHVTLGSMPRHIPNQDFLDGLRSVLPPSVNFGPMQLGKEIAKRGLAMPPERQRHAPITTGAATDVTPRVLRPGTIPRGLIDSLNVVVDR